VPAGTQLSYLIAVINRRPTPVGDVTLNLATPGGTTFISNASSPAGCATAFPCDLGEMQSGEVRLVVTTVQAATSATSPFAVTATLTPSSASANDSLTATSTQTVASGGDVQVTVSGPSTAPPGTTVKITTTLTNAGPGDAAGVLLNGMVTGTAASLPVFASNTGQCINAFPCALGTLVKGVSVSVVSSYTVPSGFQSGATFTATATSATADSNAANNTASYVFSQTSSGCSSTGGPATMLGWSGLALALLVWRRRHTF
jgi:uncharacterized protein (TIGR03382 family)